MEIKVLKNEPSELEFVLKDNRHTFPNLLRSRLLEDASVQFVAYKLVHPMDPDAQFILKTKGKGAKKALEDAAKLIENDLETLKDTLEKKLK